MEDDDHIYSHTSTRSRSASQNSQRPNNTLTLALPMQHQPNTVAGGRTGGGGGREDCWSEGATGVLIEAWGERYMELNRGNLKQKHWKEVADIVNNVYSKALKTDVQCKNRIDTVKKKYKLEKMKIASGSYRSLWTFYDRLDQLIGTKSTVNNSLTTPPLSAFPIGVRSVPVQTLKLKQQLQKQCKRLRDSRDSHSPPAYSDSSESDFHEQKRCKVDMKSNISCRKQKQDKREENCGDSVRELMNAVMRFGEAYEEAESLKLKQMVEMQKQSMKFIKEIELQRVQFFMNIQLELSQIKHSGRNVGNNNNIKRKQQ